MLRLEEILRKEEEIVTQRVTIDLMKDQHSKLMRLSKFYNAKMADIFRSLVDAIEEPEESKTITLD